MWDWEYLKQRFASHIMVDISYGKLQEELDEIDNNEKLLTGF